MTQTTSISLRCLSEVTQYVKGRKKLAEARKALKSDAMYRFIDTDGVQVTLYLD